MYGVDQGRAAQKVQSDHWMAPSEFLTTIDMYLCFYSLPNDNILD